MGKRLILSEEEKQRIKGLYVDIISEQSEMKGEGPLGTSLSPTKNTVDMILDSQNRYNDGSFWFYIKGEEQGHEVKFTGEVEGEGDSLGKPTLSLVAVNDPNSVTKPIEGTVEFVCVENGGYAQASLNFESMNSIASSNNFGDNGSPEDIVYNNFCKNKIK